MPDRRDPDRILHAMFELVMGRSSAIASGYEDAIDSDRLRHNPLMKVRLDADLLCESATSPCSRR
jgi:hypothetical protein